MHFVMYAHKPKAHSIAAALKIGALRQGHDFRIAGPDEPQEPYEIALFFGVAPETNRLWHNARKQGRAIYLDNGFLTKPQEKTVRFAWNGVQSYPGSFVRETRRIPFPRTPSFLPHGVLGYRKPPLHPAALVCLPTRNYGINVGMLKAFDDMVDAVEGNLQAKGWNVTIRPKPADLPRHERVNLPPVEWEIDRHDIVVSLNSAVSVKAMVRGKPAVCLMESTLSPWCYRTAPTPEDARRLEPAKVNQMLAILSAGEFNWYEMQSGAAFDLMLAVPESRRKGINYDGFVQ